MTKLITTLFIATIFWLFMHAMTGVIVTLYIHCDKAIKRNIKKWRCKI